MDIYCPKAGCGEPLDMDYLHDYAAEQREAGRFDYTYANARAAFQSQGCEGIGLTCSTDGDGDMAAMADALYDLLGDDLDGAAAMLEDFGMGY